MPPYGEKFEGGYIIERNPITGGSRLMYPPKGESRMPAEVLRNLKTSEVEECKIGMTRNQRCCREGRRGKDGEGKS